MSQGQDETATPDHPGDVEDGLVRATVEAAIRNKPRPSCEAVLEAERAQREVEISGGVLRRAIEAAQHQAASAVSDGAAGILSEHLRPAFDELMKELVKLGAKLADTPLNTAILIASPEPVRRAWLRLQGLSDRYFALRAAQRVLRVWLPTKDTNGVFAEYRNLPEIWPGFQLGLNRPQPPWPGDGREFMTWLATSPARPWLPTPQEQDEAVESYARSNRTRMATQLGGIATA